MSDEQKVIPLLTMDDCARYIKELKDHIDELVAALENLREPIYARECNRAWFPNWALILIDSALAAEKAKEGL